VIEVYRGSANTWECDEMGHMNVRFYLARMVEGLAAFAPAIGLPHAFAPRAPATLTLRDQHIRFLREAGPGKPFYMTAGVLDVADSSALILQQLTHASGEPCAAFQTWVDHTEVETGLAFPWSRRTRAALKAHRVDPPPAALAPRSIDMTAAPVAAPDLAAADALGAPEIGAGVVQPQHCDLLGRMHPEFFLGRVSDAVTNLIEEWREAVAEAARAGGEPVRSGGAVLEYRWVYRRWPRAGDRIVIRAGVGATAGKAYSLVYWLLDPATGAAWATAEAVSVTFNLETRKVIAPAEAHLAALRRLAPAGLAV
jgi:acyl-CoA thioester hydrolase